MSINEVSSGFAELLRRAEQERNRLSTEVIDRYSNLVGDGHGTDEGPFSIAPPCVLIADEDPVAWIDSDKQFHAISMHFDLDDSMIDEDRLPELGALGAIVPSIPLLLSSRTVLLRAIPIHQYVAPLPPGPDLPDVVSVIWSDLEKSWAACEYSEQVHVKLELAKILDQFFREILDDSGGDRQRFERQIKEQRHEFKEGFDQLLAAALTRVSANESENEDDLLDDEELIFECQGEPVSGVQASAAEFIESAFDNLREYIENFDSDVGDFPFLVQRNEDEALFKLDRNGEICFLGENFEIPSDLLDQEVDGFIALEAPGMIGKLRFIPILGSWHQIRESASELIGDEGLDLMAFGKVAPERRRKVSLIWTIVTNPDTREALEDLQTHRDEIADVDQPAFVPGNRMMTPLMQAAAHHSKALLQLLLELGADPLRQDSAGFTPLTYALQGEKLENFSLLLANGSDVDPVAPSQGTYSPLAMASDHGLLPAVNGLIEQGADVNWRSTSGATAIKFAAAAGHVDCLRRLLDAGSDAAAFDDEGFSPIHNAADSGSIEALEALLSAGVNVDLAVKAPSDDAGRTALNRACAFGNREAVELLLKSGASASRIFEDSATCLSSTLLHADVVDSDREAIVKTLLDHNALAGIGAMPAGMFLMLVLQKMSAEWASQVLAKIATDLALVAGQDDVDKFKAVTNAVVKKWLAEEQSADRRSKVLAAFKGLNLDWLTLEGAEESTGDVFSEIENNSAEAILLCLSPMAIASVHEQQDPKALLQEINQYKQNVLPVVNRLVRRLIADDKVRGVLQTVEMMVSEAAPLLEGLPSVHVDVDSAKMSTNLIAVFKLLAKKSTDEQAKVLRGLCSKITAGAPKILIVEVMGVAMLRDDKVTDDEKHVLLTVMQALGLEQRIKEIISGETSEGYAILKALIFETADVSELLFGE